MPLISIVGRPNVGKSTLFNRLVGKRVAIVSETPGTTRDRIVAQLSWDGMPLTLVDTGGLEPIPESELWEKVKAQIEIALTQADAIIFLTDTLAGLTHQDKDIAELLRRTRKPVILVVNKCDNPRQEMMASEFYQLQLGDPIPISAIHNLGIYQLKETLTSLFPTPREEVKVEERVMRLAIVGRVNVGKSSLLNRILGEERAIVSEIPGTTRDAIDMRWEYMGHSALLIDTAGIRRPGKIDPGIEKYSVLRSFSAIERANVVLLLLDALEPATAQDTHIAGHVFEAFKGLVIVVNKWDLAEKEGIEPSEVLRQLQRRLHFVPYTPVLFASALHGTGIKEVLDTAFQVYNERLRELPQNEMSRMLASILAENPPPAKGKRGLRIYRLVQEGVDPPTFAFYVNDPTMMHFSYQRYLEKALRTRFDYRTTHLKLIFKARKGNQR